MYNIMICHRMVTTHHPTPTAFHAGHPARLPGTEHTRLAAWLIIYNTPEFIILTSNLKKGLICN